MANEQENIKYPMMFPPVDDDGVRVIESEFHTLFVKKLEPITKEIETTVEGVSLKITKDVIPERNEYTLYIDSFAHDGADLHRLLYELRKGAELDELHTRIGSNGGYLDEGIALFNLMREKFRGRTTTYLDIYGYSMGAMLFSLGDTRIVYDSSKLMYHNYSGGAYGKGQELTSQVNYGAKHFDTFFRQKIVSQKFLTEDEYNRMRIGEDFWFDTLEMCKRGIATNVIVEDYLITAEQYIEYCDVSSDMTIDEYCASIDETTEPDDNDDNNETETTEIKTPVTPVLLNG